MHWTYTANAGFFGARRDRFTQYQPFRTLEEKLTLISAVEGITGVELKYPADFEDPEQVCQLLAEHQLALSAVNVDIKDATYFRHGALSAESDEARQHAIRLLCEGLDMAAEMGTPLVTTCPLADGYDYPFQRDYTSAWGNFIDSVGQVAHHRKDVTLLLEYQPHEPHSHVLLGNVGKVLHVCAEVNRSNLGANLDVGHSFAAGESPAESAALLASQNRLRYIHTNDNTGDGGDWDMISGTVHFWHWLELIHTLKRIGYTGWLGADLAPKHMSPGEAYRTNIMMVERMTDLVTQAGMDSLSDLVCQEGGIAQVFDLLMGTVSDSAKPRT